MGYAVRLDLERIYGKDLIDNLADINDDGQPDMNVVEEAISGASAIIDGYVGVRYSVPIQPAPEVLRNFCVDIATYRMAYHKLKQTDEMRKRYEDAIKFLERVADGKAALAIDSNSDGGSDDQAPGSVITTSFLNRA